MAITGGPSPAVFASTYHATVVAPSTPALLWDIARLTPAPGSFTSNFPNTFGGTFGHSVAADPAEPCTAYVGDTAGRVMKNTGCGALSWSQVGSTLLVGGNPTGVSSLSVHPTDHSILAGSNGGVVFRKKDDASDWEPLASLGITILSIVRGSASGDVVYASGGSSTVFKSTDGGTSWQAVADFGKLLPLVAGGEFPTMRIYAAMDELRDGLLYPVVVQFDCGTGEPTSSTGANAGSDGAATAAAAASPLHCSFTDPFLSPGVIPIKAVHITELRTRIDAVRRNASMEEFDWTDPVLVRERTSVQAVHLLELRAAVSEVFRHTSQPVPVFTEPVLIPGMAAKGVHINELREVVETLEGLRTAGPVQSVSGGQ